MSFVIRRPAHKHAHIMYIDSSQRYFINTLKWFGKLPEGPKDSDIGLGSGLFTLRQDRDPTSVCPGRLSCPVCLPCRQRSLRVGPLFDLKVLETNLYSSQSSEQQQRQRLEEARQPKLTRIQTTIVCLSIHLS